MNKILVTGGRGFLGKPLVEELQKDYEVFLYNYNILDKENLRNAFDQAEFDTVIHFAALNTTNDMKENPNLVSRTIIEGTKNIVKECKRTGAKLVYASSIGADNITQSHTYRSCYDVSKKMAETIILDTLHKTLILKIPAVYGKGMKSDRLLQKIKDGKFQMEEGSNNNIIEFMFLPDFIRETSLVLDSEGIYYYNSEEMKLEGFVKRYQPN